MSQKSWIIPLSLMVCFALLLVPTPLPVQSQSNVAKVTITDEELVAKDRPGEHPLITAHVSVLDAEGAHVPNLSPDRWVIREGLGKPIDMSKVEISEERVGVAVALLIDISGSMKDIGLSESRLEDVKRAVEDFMGGLREEDWVTVFTFATKVRRIQPLTTDYDSSMIKAKIAIADEQYTALFDAIYYAIGELTSQDRIPEAEFARMKKKAIFVFSDGKHEDPEGKRGYAAIDVKASLAFARLAGEDISVYAIGVGSEYDYDVHNADFHDLRRLAGITRGKFIHYFGEETKPTPEPGVIEESQNDIDIHTRAGLNRLFTRFLSQGEQYVISYGTEAWADEVTLGIEVDGVADEKEVKIPTVDPIIEELDGVKEGQTVEGKVVLTPTFRLEQAPIREVTYFVNDLKTVTTLERPFTWEWDTLTLPSVLQISTSLPEGELPKDEEGNGLIKDVSVGVKACDQKYLCTTYKVSDLTVKISHPEVEIVNLVTPITRTGTWRTDLKDTEPQELPVEIEEMPGPHRQIQQVQYYLDDKQVYLDRQGMLDVSGLGAVNEETQHTLRVRVVDELGRFGEAEVRFTVGVDIEPPTEWAKRQLRKLPQFLPTLIAVGAMAVALVTLVGFRRFRQRWEPYMDSAKTFFDDLLERTIRRGVWSEDAQLVLVEGETETIRRLRKGETSLGRFLTNNIRFGNRGVSRFHAEITEGEGATWWIRDLCGSTWVDGKKVTAREYQPLRHRSRIELGRDENQQPIVELRFEMLS